MNHIDSDWISRDGMSSGRAVFFVGQKKADLRLKSKAEFDALKKLIEAAYYLGHSSCKDAITERMRSVSAQLKAALSEP